MSVALAGPANLRVENIDLNDPLNTNHRKNKYTALGEITKEVGVWMKNKKATQGPKNILLGILDFIENLQEEENLSGELFLVCDSKGALYSAGVLRKHPESIYLSFFSKLT